MGSNPTGVDIFFKIKVNIFFWLIKYINLETKIQRLKILEILNFVYDSEVVKVKVKHILF